jgi:hypothetical protein
LIVSNSSLEDTTKARLKGSQIKGTDRLSTRALKQSSQFSKRDSLFRFFEASKMTEPSSTKPRDNHFGDPVIAELFKPKSFEPNDNPQDDINWVEMTVVDTSSQPAVNREVEMSAATKEFAFVFLLVAVCCRFAGAITSVIAFATAAGVLGLSTSPRHKRRMVYTRFYLLIISALKKLGEMEIFGGSKGFRHMLIELFSQDM